MTSTTVDRGAGALASALDLLPRRSPSLAVLTYHRVAPADERPDLHPGLRVDPTAFADQLAAIARHAEPVSTDDLLAAEAGDRPLPPRAVHVTLDDGYGCTARHAWPALRRAGVPATLFVPTEHPDNDRTFWWDRLHHALRATEAPTLRAGGRDWPVATPDEVRASFAALRSAVGELPHDEGLALVEEITAAADVEPARPDTCSWDDLRRMAAEGLALAPHSRTHALLHRIPPADLDDEVGRSWTDLVDRVGAAARPLFAPPGGGYDDGVLAAARRAGLRIIMTTERGVNMGATPPWGGLRRINVGPRATTGLVRIQLRDEAHRARAGALAARTRVRRSLPARGGQKWS